MGDPDGVDAISCSISHLTNAGAIIGGGRPNAAAAGGIGVLNDQTITALTNAGAGAITGGVGGEPQTLYGRRWRRRCVEHWRSPDVH